MGALSHGSIQANPHQTESTVQELADGQAVTTLAGRKIHTMLYHLQTHSVLECNNRQLGDFLQALLLTRGQNE